MGNRLIIPAPPRILRAARGAHRWLEQVNSGHLLEAAGKYEVSKTLSEVEGSQQVEVAPTDRKQAPLLTAA